MIAVLLAVLAGGVLPAHMTVMSLAVLWAPWTVLAIISASALCRGHLRSAESSHYTLITATIFTRALRCALRAVPDQVQGHPEGGRGHGRLAVPAQRASLDRGGRGPGRRPGLAGPRDPRLRARPAPSGLGRHLCHGPRHLGAVPAGPPPFASSSAGANAAAQVRFACLAPATIGNQTGQRSYGRVVDVSVSGVGLVIAEEVAAGALLHVDFALPGLDDQPLAVAATVTVKSARQAPGGGWWLGTNITMRGRRLARQPRALLLCGAPVRAPARKPPRGRRPAAVVPIRAVPRPATVTTPGKPQACTGRSAATQG